MEIAKTTMAADANPATADFWDGVRDSLPLMAGVFPFGITCGVMGLTAGLSPMETAAMSLLVFAGAAQFVSIAMFGAGVAGWSIYVLTALLINLRHLLMGASLAPYMSRLPAALQAVLAFGMVDETYAVTMDRVRRAGYSAKYQLGSNLAMYLTWNAATAAGVLAGAYIPDPLAWGLDFAMPATFLAMLMPRLADWKGATVCAAAALTAMAGFMYLPGKWYLIIACLAAALVGGLLEGGSDHAE